MYGVFDWDQQIYIYIYMHFRHIPGPFLVPCGDPCLFLPRPRAIIFKLKLTLWRRRQTAKFESFCFSLNGRVKLLKARYGRSVIPICNASRWERSITLVDLTGLQHIPYKLLTMWETYGGTGILVCLCVVSSRSNWATKQFCSNYSRGNPKLDPDRKLGIEF